MSDWVFPNARVTRGPKLRVGNTESEAPASRGRKLELPELIGVGKAINLPSLRTVHAVLPHTALQLAVSISGQIDDSNLLQGASVIATK
jgi:hypothetical protein